jgi:tellurite resistance protein TerC
VAVELILWTVFAIAVAAGVAMDVKWAIKGDSASDDRRPVRAVLSWICVALLFGVLIACSMGRSSALKFFAGYFLELSLSVDNLFAFMAIVDFFQIKGKDQQRALTCGIVCAIAMRMFFIFVGIALLNAFEWLMYVFGLMLILSAIGMLKSRKTSECQWKFFEKFGAILKFGRSTDASAKTHSTDAPAEAHSTDAPAKTTGRRQFIACIIAIEMADLLFAVDSVTAVLSITRESFLVFSSNVFALIGLRALYFYLEYLARKLHLLKYGIAITLIFVGVKMMLSKIYHISIAASMLTIAAILGVTVIASCATGGGKGGR